MTSPQCEEDPFLCRLFGDNSRFVDFKNLSGRPVRLTSRLELTRLRHQAWSSSRILTPGEGHTWRFLGDDVLQESALAFLELLPDPYSLARDNSYLWTAGFLDTADRDRVTFDGKAGPLDLETLRELQPGERLEVVIRRQGQTVAPLSKLCLDRLVRERRIPEEEVESLEIPSSLRGQLARLSRDYEDMDKIRVDTCARCQEIHL